MWLLICGAFASTLEVQFGPVADRGAARHQLVPTVGARLQLDRPDRALFTTGELRFAVRRIRSSLYTHTAQSTRAAVGVGLIRRNDRVGVSAWAGPAVAARVTQFDGETRFTLDPAIRASSGVFWQPERVGVGVQFGTMARFERVVRWDFDGTLGLLVTL